MQPPLATTHLAMLVALDAEHDNLLLKLEELDLRIQQVLRDHQPLQSAPLADADRLQARRPEREMPVPPVTAAGPGDPTC